MLAITKKFIKNYNINIIFSYFKQIPKSIKQIGKNTFYKKKRLKNIEIDIKNSIKSQLNLLKVVDNNNYSTFFEIYEENIS